MGSTGNRKHHRNRVKCDMYRKSERRKFNKMRRALKYLKHRLNWLTNRIKRGVATEKQIIEQKELALRFEK
jgi:hypothetical protein